MDHISQLPHNIIHHIQSLLSLKEATRTCILSKTWKNMCSLYPIIHLDYNKFIRSHYDDVKPDHDAYKKTFMDFVNNYMHSLVVSQQGSFQVRQLYLNIIDKDYENPFSHVNHMVEFLKQHYHVYAEELCLVVQKQPTQGWEELVKRCPEMQPFIVVPCSTILASNGFQVLAIEHCNFGHRKKTFAKLLSNFASLKELHLSYVELVDDLVFLRLMRSCPLLEVIKLYNCRSSKKIKTFKVPEFLMITTMSLYHNSTANVSTQFSIRSMTLKSFRNQSSNSVTPWPTRGACISVNKLYLKELGGYSSDFFKDLETNFPLLEEVEIYDGPEDNSDQNITHHRIRTLQITSPKSVMKSIVMDCPCLTQFSYSGWGMLEMSMDCSNLTQFTYSGNTLPEVGLFNSSLDIGRFQISIHIPDVAINTNWFVKLKRFIDLAGSNKTFLELISHNNTNKVKFVEGKEAVKIYPNRQVNLQVRFLYPVEGQSSLVDGLLWSTHPTTLTVHGNRYCYDFIKHLCNKLSYMKSKKKPPWYYNRKKWWYYIKDFEVKCDLGNEGIKERLSDIANVCESSRYPAPTTTFKFHWIINIT